MIVCLHSCRISDEESSCKEKIIMNDDTFMRNTHHSAGCSQYSAGCSHQFVSSLTSKPYSSP